MCENLCRQAANDAAHDAYRKESPWRAVLHATLPARNGARGRAQQAHHGVLCCTPRFPQGMGPWTSTAGSSWRAVLLATLPAGPGCGQAAVAVARHGFHRRHGPPQGLEQFPRQVPGAGRGEGGAEGLGREGGKGVGAGAH